MQHKKRQHKRVRTLTGVITVTKNGTGFFMHEDIPKDIRIETQYLHTALNGDTVEIVRFPHTSRDERQQGKVLNIISRAQEHFVGTLTRENHMWLLKPDNPLVYTAIRLITHKGAQEGYKALVHITKWDDPSTLPEGVLEKVIGKAGEHETEMEAIVLDRGFVSEFPKAVEDAARTLQRESNITDEERRWREDYTAIPTCTIDPDDAKDFDDALSIQTLPNGNYEVGVHIADVTHYVRPGSLLETEAQKRATSVYLVDRTIPMLPEIISNDLCSLNPHEEKRAFSVIFEMDTDARVVKKRFAKTLITSRHRFTYRNAQNILDGEAHEYDRELRTLWALSQKLKAKRIAKGAIEFTNNEIQFELDAHGAPVQVHIKEHLNTMKLIEEFMLLANSTVAKHISECCVGKNPSHSMSIYRIHDAPDPDKLAELSVFLRALGHDHLGGDLSQIETKDIAQLLREVRGTPEEAVVQMATLRSMAKAVYSDKNIGHFSLGFKHYTHFTSPIRRYPDMMVHRILFAHLHHEPLTHEELLVYRRMATAASQREVEAVRAERDSVKFKQVEYMRTRIGDTFDGKITGVSKGGIFVAEVTTQAEGMVRMSTIPGGWYELDEKRYAIVNTNNGTTYRIGDTVRIRLAGVYLETRELDWEIIV
tara:strand:+ start:42146 stop:44095 length:1950 start_codon:yes stop_codon:yes gene_type:complete